MNSITSRSNVLHQTRAVALIIVLSMLVLLSAMIVAFMSTVSVDRTATQASVSGSVSRQIADSTVNLVIGQIREATSQKNEATTWASQPGAIRTISGRQIGKHSTRLRADGYFYGYAASDSPDSTDFVYKLYSADRMRVPASDYSPNAKDDDVTVVEGWDRTKPDEKYADLNEPMLIQIKDSGGDTFTEPRYPIIDPRAKYHKDGSRNTDPVSGIVDGFDVKIQEDSTLKLENDAAVPYVPMPVKWLYVMRDGTIGPASLASDENPIIGRTAFWTDDETCKLNINVASEGTFWDTPSMSSKQESGNIAAGNPPASGVLIRTVGMEDSLSLASSQPVKGEYQRYSGHPATTSLSPVLGWLWGVDPSTSTLPLKVEPKDSPYFKFKEAIYQITPFIPSGLGTTQGATRNSKLDVVTANGLLNITTKHLYSSVDELIFKGARNDSTDLDPNSTGLGPKPILNDVFTPDALERTRFFLTTNSRAPELNLFGRPRVTIWPVNAEPKLRTQFDDAFTFASTIYKSPDRTASETKDKRFLTFRYDAKDDHNDFDFPGSKIPKYNGDSQNKRMYEYLQWLTSVRGVPGFGGKFSQKYNFARTDKIKDSSGMSVDASSIERDQILTEIFDYMRSVNLADTGTGSQSATRLLPYTPLFYTVKPSPAAAYTRFARSVDWAAQVTPLKIKNTMGMGRFITISEAAILFHRTGPLGGDPASQQRTRMQAVLLLEMTSPMAGYPALRETYFTKIRAVDASGSSKPFGVTFANGGGASDIGLCSIPGLPGPMQPQFVNINNVSSHEVTGGRGFMPSFGFTSGMHWMREHKAPTQIPPINPGSDGNRNTLKDCYVKQFTNKSPHSLAYPASPFNYTRDPGTTPLPVRPAYPAEPLPICTAQAYPYVSNPITIPYDAVKKTFPAEFQLKGGTLEVEIWSGEAPDDPRKRLVQTVMLEFKDITTPPPPAPPTPLPPIPGHIAADPLFEMRFNPSLASNTTVDLDVNANCIKAEDTVRSIEMTGPLGGTPQTVNKGGDVRLAMTRQTVPVGYFSPRDGYFSTTRRVDGLTTGHGERAGGGTVIDADASSLAKGGVKVGSAATSPNKKLAILPKGIDGVQRFDGGPGDWVRGLSKHLDGALGDKVDEGNVYFRYTETGAGRIPYYRGRAIEDTGQSFFTPNRQLPSAVMFGSLPTGALEGRPWQTLLFRPDRDSVPHPGAALNGLGIPDHLFLDLFHIPVVEPFAISEPFSTMAKVNMNYVIAPFGYATQGGNNPETTNPRSYLRRDTALRGVLKSTFITAVPTNVPEKGHDDDPLRVDATFRYPIDLNRTLETFETRLKTPGQPLFRTASEICDIDLYPKGLLVTNWDKFWNIDYAQTGDNQRERPYAHIFPRLTTKSNVYTVHMRCQAIRKAPGSKADEFDEKKDTVVSEYRGQATIERFIDPNDRNLEKYDEFNVDGDGKIDPYYRYRVINVKQFAPH